MLVEYKEAAGAGFEADGCVFELVVNGVVGYF